MRILIDPSDGVRELSNELSSMQVEAEELDEPGFLVTPGDGNSTLSVFVDRSGIILVRALDFGDFVRAVRRCLESLSPPATNARGLRVRAVARKDKVAVIPLSEVTDLAVLERDVQRRGGELLPAMRIWVDDENQLLDGTKKLQRLLISGDPLMPPPSVCEAAVRLAGTFVRYADEQTMLEEALRMVSTVEVVSVDSSRRSDLAKALVPAD